MSHQHRSFANSHPASSTFGAFAGLVGLTQPITDLVSGAIAALGAMRSRARENANRRRTLDALHRLDRRMLADIGLQPGDLMDVANHNLPLEALERRRNARARHRGTRLDTALKSRRSAVNDEEFSIVA